jgi:DNA repair protein RadD
LTTGFDHPAIDAIVMLRPTQSPGLYVQMCGRGLRMHESKTDCLILDFGGNVKRHGFIDAITPPGEKSNTPGIAPVKECPDCQSLVAISARQCDCGHEFEMNERASEKTMYTGAMLSVEAKPVWYEVDRVFYSNHLSKKNINTLRVDYFSGLVRFSEYICIEHDGYALDKAKSWWSSRAKSPLPNRVAAAMNDISSLDKPSRILVSNKGKFPEVISYEFDVETIAA